MDKKFKLYGAIGALVLALIIAIGLFLIIDNKSIDVSEFTVSSEDLPDSFDGYKIVQISDLHDAKFGKDNRRLLKKIKKAEPDIIVITGDLVDSQRTDIEKSLNFVGEAQKIAPCYYVAGNHENRISEYDDLIDGLTRLGVIMLDDESKEITVSGEKITICGVHDPESLKGESYGYDEVEILKKRLSELEYHSNDYTILLSHRPEGFDLYCEHEFDLVFTGHAHGGQVRLPFIGGVYAPIQGIFPKYDAGLFTSGKTSMVVSRGLGNSRVPIRLFNSPELVVVTLTK